jgi:hypothetical protein
VTVRFRSLLAATVGLCVALPLSAQEPGRFAVERGRSLPPQQTANEQLANTIGEHLQQSGRLHHYTVDLAVHDGVVVLTGTVIDQPQREEVLRIVQGVPGVDRVIDRLNLVGAITQVQAAAPPAVLREPQGPDLGGGPATPPPPPAAGPVPAPGNGGGGPAAGMPTEPMPMYQAPIPSPYDLNPPKMPPYAWPSYAPYNNYSRVAYPQAYPYEAFPFIGPVYPFPKVPLGWRRVKLEWDDGKWWFSKVACPYDWWRLRYW